MIASGLVVVDSSLAIKWAAQEERTAEARALLFDWDRRAVQRLAPTIFASEINTPLLKLRRVGAINATEAYNMFDAILTTVSTVNDDRNLLHRARDIADSLLLRTAHDSLYVALAEREGCEVWTADERFYNVARSAFPRVRWIGEHTASAQTART